MEKKVQIGMLCEIYGNLLTLSGVKWTYYEKTIEYIERLLQWGSFFDRNCWK